MNSTHGKSRRTAGVVLAAVLSALMVLALPSIASAHHGRDHQRASGHHGKRHHHRRHHRRHRRNRHLSSADGSVGTIVSFDADTGKLVIGLDGGDTVSGLVTERTHIRCGGGCDNSADDSSGDQGASASNAGPRPDSPGHDGTPPGSSEDPGQGADHAANLCTTDDLVEGAVVKGAELVIVGGKAYFTLVALGK